MKKTSCIGAMPATAEYENTGRRVSPETDAARKEDFGYPSYP